MLSLLVARRDRGHAAAMTGLFQKMAGHGQPIRVCMTFILRLKFGQPLILETAAMGRSSRAQADENRLRILEAAGALFRARGVEDVGIADVMKAAGMTQGGFYNHFSSKDAITTEACAQSFDGAAQKWRQIAADA